MKSIFDDLYIIAEVGQTHDGSLGQAHAFIEAVATTGVNAIKFQTHYASEESTLDDQWRVKFSYQDQTRYDYWQRMEFEAKQWDELAKHSRRKGLDFISTPFSLKAVNILQSLGMPFWKIASGEINNPELLDGILKTKQPVVVSTGLCNSDELDSIVSKLSRNNIEFAILQCTTNYPVMPEDIGLLTIPFFRKKYLCSVGLSDHSGSIYPSIAAVSLGATIVEVHITLNEYMFGPDVRASVTIEDLKELVQGCRYIYKSLNANYDKDEISRRLEREKTIFGRSLALKENLPKGTLLKKEHLTLKKPGTGIPANLVDTVVGKTLQKDKSYNRLLTWDDIS